MCAYVCVCVCGGVRWREQEQDGTLATRVMFCFHLYGLTVYMLTLSADPLCLLMLLRISRDRRRRSFVENTLEVTHNHTVTPKRRSVEEGEDRTEGVFEACFFDTRVSPSGPCVGAICQGHMSCLGGEVLRHIWLSHYSIPYKQRTRHKDSSQNASVCVFVFRISLSKM